MTPLAAQIGDHRKIVVSNQRLGFTWRNSEQLEGDLVEAVTALKAEAGGGDIAISGSVSVVRQLLDAGLIDELHLLVDPIALREGLRLFDDSGTTLPLALLSSTALATCPPCRLRPAGGATRGRLPPSLPGDGRRGSVLGRVSIVMSRLIVNVAMTLNGDGSTGRAGTVSSSYRGALIHLASLQLGISGSCNQGWLRLAKVRALNLSARSAARGDSRLGRRSGTQP